MKDGNKTMRQVAFIIGAAASIVGLGIALLLTRWHPMIGVWLMGAGAMYLLWELLTCAPLVKIVPEGMLRFLAGVMIVAFVILIAGSDIEKALYPPETTAKKEPQANEPQTVIPKPENPSPPLVSGASSVCRIKATTKSELMSRIFFQGSLDGAEVGEPRQAQPEYQELFVEWNLKITTTNNAGDVSVTLKDSKKPTYRLRIQPEDTQIPDATAAWMSGFSEPREPDYYKRVITFRNLNKQATITTRSPLKMALGKNQIEASDFPVTDVEIVATDSVCKTELPEAETSVKRFLRLIMQLQAFVDYRYGKGKDRQPVKIHMDPDEPVPPLSPNEVEMSFELRCRDAECKQMVAGQLEARRKPPSKPPS